jgi:hypothetical protein
MEGNLLAAWAFALAPVAGGIKSFQPHPTEISGGIRQRSTYRIN